MPEERSVVWHRKLGIALLVTVSLATTLFGAILVYKGIYDPLRPSGKVTFKSDEQLEAERVAAQKAADTDTDGLSDYDELYIYRTSPYLKDSDSDDLEDGAEIAQNSDPNCRKGTVCRAIPAPTPVAGSGSGSGTGGGVVGGTNAAVNPDANPDANVNTATQAEKAFNAFLRTFGNPTTLSQAQIDAKVDLMTSAQLRDFLGEIGLSDEEIAPHSEASLKIQLKETLKTIFVGAN